MKRIWKWLKDDANRDIIKMGAATLAAIIAGTWAVLTFVVDRHASPRVSAAPGGVAAGRDISGNTITQVTPATAGTKPP
jgi:hypothetical protein